MGGVIYSMMSIECHNSDSLTHRQEVSWSIIVATLLTSFASLGFEYRFKITWIHFAPHTHNVPSWEELVSSSLEVFKWKAYKHLSGLHRKTKALEKN